MNTFSNVGFVVVGLGIAWVVDRGRLYAEHNNLLNRQPLYCVAFAVVVALLGPGSMFLHASQTVWGHRVDVSSMYLFVCVLIAYGVARWRGLSRGQAALTYLVLSVVFVGTTFVAWIPDEVAFGVLLVGSIALELHLARTRPHATRKLVWICAAIAAFLTAFAIWIPSLSGGAWCDPESFWQGHAAWHVLCAVAAGCIFAYLRSEHESAPA